MSKIATYPSAAVMGVVAKLLIHCLKEELTKYHNNVNIEQQYNITTVYNIPLGITYLQCISYL